MLLPDWRTVETRSRPARREIRSARSASSVVVDVFDDVEVGRSVRWW